MKQHITVEQVNELSDKGKEELREWWKPTWGDITSLGQVVITHSFNLDSEEEYFMASAGDQSAEETLKSECFPLLTIGQMIEFLGSLSRIDSVFLLTWEMNDSPDEFCDTLWEAVKEILEK